MNEKYNYEQVKEAYKAIIRVGESTVKFGQVAANIMHRRNLRELDKATKELYEKLINDEDINYN